MLGSKKKGDLAGLVMFIVIAVAIVFMLLVGSWIGKAMGVIKQKTRLKGVVEVYMNLDDKGTEFSFLAMEKDGENFMEILGVMASGAKVEGTLKTQLESIEKSLESITKNSDKSNYYISLMDSSGDVVYEKKTGDPPFILGVGPEDIELGWPLETENDQITSGFGWRTHPVTGDENTFHGGMDIDGDEGNPVLYSGRVEGEVVRVVRDDPSLGIFVVVEYVSPKTNIPYHIYYGHLNRAYVRVGDRVKNGDVIGEVGNTGVSTKPHLHLEIRKDENEDDYYMPKEESLNPCFYTDLSPASEPWKCMQRCAVYEDPMVCETVTTVMGTSASSIVKNRFDIPLLGGKKGELELVLW